MPESLSRRKLLVAIGAGCFARPAFAQGVSSYPSKPVQLVVPYPAGGAVDLAARLVAEKLRGEFGQPVIVENRPGANGMVGTAAVARAEPDGHTLLMAPREVFGINPLLMPQQAIDAKRDFTYVGVVATGAYVLVVNPGLGVNSFAELVALAKTRELAYASFGKGSMAHFNIEALARRLGVKMVHVPYRGAPPAVAAVATGEVALTIATPPAALSLMLDGKVKALAVGDRRRLPQMSTVPTMAELGFADDPLVPNFFGLALPAGTPAPIVEKIGSAAARAIASPDIAAKLEASGLVPSPGSPSQMAQLVAADLDRFGRLMRELDIKASE
ncbi:tripartite tricarboxylate transporter substrate binding protein [Bosea sp. (in: a-proteobacteria)]|uniref:Bug family tripartite tricarboxylate transporter substrate binding protein n=1 Tax=Bosea sp. (in: a-proteobacteria) TaxID=1871050 RepID=UPI0027351C96|nr:tripartite tricarboxylate transporter substrate binding protein [Bosea sp. (in: a-proteobacteria)]MDP3256995.1 tripartite tricarboxylate transporter substrate binding protein [Bosea sp. (in: a-proteobacteria)]